MRRSLAIGCPNVDDLREIKRLVGLRLNPIPLMQEKGCILFPPGAVMLSDGDGTAQGDAWKLHSGPNGPRFWMDAADFK